MNAQQRVRVGIIGAGRNVRARHVPGFRAIEGVELVSVCNRSPESSQRAATEFGIPTIYENWLELVEADDTDAICIGTWPYMHCPITLAALENDKHVLTEARMAMNAAEAQSMLDAARALPHLVTQVVPAPTTFKVDRTIQEQIASGFLGDIIAIEMRTTERRYTDPQAPFHWRQNAELSGYNILNMGIMYETLMRWVGPATKVMAMTKTVVKQRRDAEGLIRAVTVPDHVDVLCEMACGAQAHLQFSGVTVAASANEAVLHGTQGTLCLDMATSKLYGKRRSDSSFSEIEIPPQKQGQWRVEEEFINAIRGIEPVKLTTFEVGVQYMEFTEAVTRSAQSGEAISLPL